MKTMSRVICPDTGDGVEAHYRNGIVNSKAGHASAGRTPTGGDSGTTRIAAYAHRLE